MARKFYYVFDSAGKFCFSIFDTPDGLNTEEIKEKNQTVVETELVYDFANDYTLVDGEIVVKKGTTPGHSAPPKEEVAMLRLRHERNRLLVDVVDRISRIYTNQNKAVPQNVIDYRQELLDLPQNVVPEVDDLGNELTNVTWPDEPEE